MTVLRHSWLGLVLLLLSTLAQAHNLGTSYSQWILDANGANVQARVSQLQLSRLQLDPRYTPQYLSVVAEHLASQLQFWAGEQRCAPHGMSAQSDADGWVSATWRVDCPSPKNWLVRTRLFETVAPSHLHFVRIDHLDTSIQQRVLNFAEPSLHVDQVESQPRSLAHFIDIGIQHILSGWDHLAFVLMLILLARNLREVAVLATGFTLAHSLTLAAASLGWILVEQARVEALIGFSIALIAAENLWLKSARDPWIPRLLVLSLVSFSAFSADLHTLGLIAGLILFTACYFALLAQTDEAQRWRLALTFIFGLVHGFGFAGLMAEMQLPASQLRLGLLGFNLGVEIGQLAVIAAIWPLLLWLRRYPSVAAWGTQGVSAAVAGLGVFWFVTRLLI